MLLKTAPEHTAGIIQIDPDGDLILRVGASLQKNGEPKLFKVCTSTFRRASPAWRDMLSGPRKEAKLENGSLIIDLPKDSPKHLRVLLDIVHANFEVVPKEPTVDDIAGILAIAEKYGLISRLQLWSDGWASVIRANLHQQSSYCPLFCTVKHIQIASAAWRLGCDDVFAQQTRYFVFNSKMSRTKGGQPRNLVTWCGDSQPISALHAAGLDDFKGI
jgi:hypothetical protein